jgi:hypothetical protein
MNESASSAVSPREFPIVLRDTTQNGHHEQLESTGSIDPLQRMRSIEDALTILDDATRRLCHGSSTVWRFVFDARTHLENQIVELLRTLD